MPQLFQLPLTVPLSTVGQLLPGAKLSFFATGTSDPQPVYTDIDLEVAHSQPVEANGAGVFDPIYLDAALPNYRVLLTDANDVTQPGYPIDEVPSNQSTAQTIRLVAPAPELIFEETDASSGNKKWRLKVNAEGMTLDIGNDAESVWTNVLAINRAGTTVDGVTREGNELAVQTSGSFTATLTGVADATTGTINWKRTGHLVTLYANASITGTSNATTKTLTGMPAEIRPTNNKDCVCRLIEDSNTAGGIATVASSGTISLGLGVETPDFAGFDSTPEEGGTGIGIGWQISYVID